MLLSFDRMKNSSFILLFFFFVSCIDPYQVELDKGAQLLTIDGIITSIPQVHSIRLTRSDTYGSVFQGLVRPVTGATVIVRDDLGNVTFFPQNNGDPGRYDSPANFATVIGRSYTLQIQTVEGKVYTSFPERVESVPEIKDLTYQVIKIPVEGEINPKSGVQLIASLDDPADQNNFYLWRNNPSVYVLKTRPDLFTPRPSDANPSRDPQPKDCCNTCFRSELVGNQSLFIAQDDNFNGLNTRLPVGFIEDDGLRFIQTYRVDLRQMSVSQEAYRFLRLVKQQTEISGSVFDPPPANIRGNMISLDDPEEEVLGYFIAGAERKKRIYINGADLDFRQNVAIIPDDCRLVEGAQINPPIDWNP
ncbi:MAG: hypothetical protein ACI8YP_001886 [Algoriphagus sp.]|jgi:hypothetical protein|tara:strand:- start:431 stop:1513 length:1083 start_codon:yes stop_codon:yes gene_type:complete